MGSNRASTPLRSLFLRSPALPLALGLFLLLALAVRGMGVVGEVAAAWTWGPPPRVAVDLAGGVPTWSDPDIDPHAGSSWGPLLASQTRPVERVQLGSAWFPVAVNGYTGGLSDWPARALHGVSRSPGLVAALHVLFGGCVLVMMWRFLRHHGWTDAPSTAVLVLAADWTFVFYRRVLGGTEVLLLAAGLALLWALWRHRRRPGSRDWLWISLALGIGLQAKVTFAATAAAFLLAYAATARDRPRETPTTPLRPLRMLGVVAALTTPVWLALLHGLALPAGPRVWSHDGLAMQLSRAGHGVRGLLVGGSEPAREAPASLAYFLLEPSKWFEGALGADPVGWLGAGPRCVGWVLVVVAVTWAWRGRSGRALASEPAESLLRFLSVAAPLQLALLWLANRDLHHLAQAAPTIALLVGLSCERIARRLAPPGSTARVVWALVLALPFVLAGVWSCLRTLPTLRTVPSLAVTAHGQRALIDMLHEHEVRQLWTSDYDLYGVFEVLDPDLELAHAWGAASASRDRAVLLQDLLLAARGGHYLVVSPSAPRIYDLHPSHAQLESAASTVGVRLGLLDEVGAGNKASARLYKVESR